MAYPRRSEPQETLCCGLYRFGHAPGKRFTAGFALRDRGLSLAVGRSLPRVIAVLTNQNVGRHKFGSSMKKVSLYTDGACSGNPGPGGWAFILRCGKTEKELERSDGDPQTTNNKMELDRGDSGARGARTNRAR